MVKDNLDTCCYCGKEFNHRESPAWSYCADCYEKEQEGDN